MTNTVIVWVEKELGILKDDAEAVVPSVIAWAHNFLADITPVMIQAANDAVVALVTAPGSGAVKFAAAVEAAGADLATKGIPIAVNDLKALVQIAYNALPSDAKDASAGAAVTTAVDTAIDAAGATAAKAIE